ncbi:hypothetical protein M0D69_16805 [Caballeronia sp. SEWSISQ10-4 2]|uniref:hypothetical protein n=1 Tax=Caballeronia sp. SEWSISQ10-4 2 TaxID=2937438 RepID=UPI00264F02C8|nr:hypothetical protein [Caballeronia sp. SEWSISQ10-4 2]MDN7179617.1 hypothetical protein [Caballeronia sp. SEWSISQ10-4 2]
MDPDEVILSKLCSAVVGYLKRHPQAADTVRGIGNWWLPVARCHADARALQRALDRLVGQGRVTRYALLDGTILYASSEGRQPGLLRKRRRIRGALVRRARNARVSGPARGRRSAANRK